MPSLFIFSSTQNKSSKTLSKGEKLSVAYHNIFDFPLSFADLIKWRASDEGASNIKNITSKNGYYFIEGKESSIYKRSLNKRISTRKMLIAKKAANILSYIPTIKLVAVTGSLAMENSNEESDIDLLIITKSRALWTSRLLAYLIIGLFGIHKRSPADRNQKDKLCLNMWLDESDLVWNKRNRNLYTAHEIAQIVPLINKAQTYEKFLRCNRWILDFWPNSVRVTELKSNRVTKRGNFFVSVSLYLCNLVTSVVEKIAFNLQKIYMSKKITRETITPTRALFHPQDWGKIVLTRLAS